MIDAVVHISDVGGKHNRAGVAEGWISAGLYGSTSAGAVGHASCLGPAIWRGVVFLPRCRALAQPRPRPGTGEVGIFSQVLPTARGKKDRLFIHIRRTSVVQRSATVMTAQSGVVTQNRETPRRPVPHCDSLQGYRMRRRYHQSGLVSCDTGTGLPASVRVGPGFIQQSSYARIQAATQPRFGSVD